MWDFRCDNKQSLAKLYLGCYAICPMATVRKTRFSRRVPDHVTDELVNVLSDAKSYEFNVLFGLVYENLKLKNAVSGGEEMLRLRSYEKLQNLVGRGLVEKKLKDLEERDKLRNFQPVITGEMIMEAFGLKPAKEVGIIKEMVREAILEGVIPNEYEQAFAYMIREGEKMGLKAQ